MKSSEDYRKIIQKEDYRGIFEGMSKNLIRIKTHNVNMLKNQFNGLRPSDFEGLEIPPGLYFFQC
jgi:hypothetical protein